MTPERPVSAGALPYPRLAKPAHDLPCGRARAHARKLAASRWDRRIGFTRPPPRSPPPKKSLNLRRERRRGRFSKFGGLGFRYRGHSDHPL